MRSQRGRRWSVEGENGSESMRARNIKPGLCHNENLGECSLGARLLFVMLPMLADREGRIEYRPRRIKAELFPYDDMTLDQFEAMIGELEQFGSSFISRYSANGIKCIQITNFVKHQRPHPDEKRSQLPPPPLNPTAASEIQRPLALNAECGMLNAESPTLNAEGGGSATPQKPAAQVLGHPDISKMPGTVNIDKPIPRDDGFEGKVSAFLGRQQITLKVQPCPAVFNDFRKLNDAVGWESACELVLDCAKRKDIIYPVKVALARMANRQGQELAERDNSRVMTENEGVF